MSHADLAANNPTGSEHAHDVEAEPAWEPSIDGARIAVALSAGVAILTGGVKSYAEKDNAERVAGVRGHLNETKVDVPQERTDTDLATKPPSRSRGTASFPATASR